MRLIAETKDNDPEIKRLMIHDTGEGVFLFGYDTKVDSSCLWDQWFEELKYAIEYCEEAYEVKSSDWQEIPDPLDGCQQDWIASVRVKGRDTGDPEWGKLEKLENGELKEFEKE
jgi:biofilm protein TabA